MHRLGGLAHLPSALTPTLGAASTSAASLPLPSVNSMSNTSIASSSSGDPWGALHVHVLPLFNGEPLRIPMSVPTCDLPFNQITVVFVQRGPEYPS